MRFFLCRYFDSAEEKNAWLEEKRKDFARRKREVTPLRGGTERTKSRKIVQDVSIGQQKGRREFRSENDDRLENDEADDTDRDDEHDESSFWALVAASATKPALHLAEADTSTACISQFSVAEIASSIKPNASNMSLRLSYSSFDLCTEQQLFPAADIGANPQILSSQHLALLERRRYGDVFSRATTQQPGDTFKLGGRTVHLV